MLQTPTHNANISKRNLKLKKKGWYLPAKEPIDFCSLRIKYT